MCSHDAGAYLWVGFLGEHGAWLALVDYFQTFGKLSFGILKKKLKQIDFIFRSAFTAAAKLRRRCGECLPPARRAGTEFPTLSPLPQHVHEPLRAAVSHEPTLYWDFLSLPLVSFPALF